MVYVQDAHGHPLMPTTRYGKVRRMLQSGRAKVIKRCPFTIQLTYESTHHTQPVSLGVDAGSKHIGISATAEKETLYEADVTLRNDIPDLLAARRQARRSRRSRKTRYRKARFLNRKRTDHWLAPSMKQKIDSHLAVVEQVCKLLPVTEIIAEVASFDTQLLQAQLSGDPLPEGTDYQNGTLAGWNLREYVFHRDGYTCQWCRGKSKDPILVTHHWNYWRGDHTNKAGSLITLCNTCNDSKYHKPDAPKMHRLWGWEPRITHNFKDAAFMSTMRWAFYNRLKETYEARGIQVSLTYGYITKNTRIQQGLPKEHYIDARCICRHPEAVSSGEVFFQKKVRCHNRQMYKANTLKDGIRKRNQAPYEVKGFRLFDKVRFRGQECFITGRRTRGYFALKTLDGTTVHTDAPCRAIKLLEPRRYYLTERRCRA